MKMTNCSIPILREICEPSSFDLSFVYENKARWGFPTSNHRYSHVCKSGNRSVGSEKRKSEGLLIDIPLRSFAMANSDDERTPKKVDSVSTASLATPFLGKSEPATALLAQDPKFDEYKLVKETLLRYQKSVASSQRDVDYLLQETQRSQNSADITTSSTNLERLQRMSNDLSNEPFTIKREKRLTNHEQFAGKKAAKKSKYAPSSRLAKPKRPMSAYNLFFHDERIKLLQSNRDVYSENVDEKLGFQALAQIVSNRWKSIDSKTLEWYKERAAVDRRRYDSEMKEFESRKEEDLNNLQMELVATVDEETKRQYFAKYDNKKK